MTNQISGCGLKVKRAVRVGVQSGVEGFTPDCSRTALLAVANAPGLFGGCQHTAPMAPSSLQGIRLRLQGTVANGLARVMKNFYVGVARG